MRYNQGNVRTGFEFKAGLSAGLSLPQSEMQTAHAMYCLPGAPWEKTAILRTDQIRRKKPHKKYFNVYNINYAVDVFPTRLAKCAKNGGSG